jgi:two-component system CheB/CheR fusion protein
MTDTDALSVEGEAASDEAPSHVVAIGASAGGLEPIELLFDQLPTRTGAAFVLIQHLSPDFKSLMDQLLARHTSMQIVRVADRTRILRDRVYLIPPRKEMVVADGELLLRDRDEDVAVNLPIDVFLRSLAAEYGEQAVAVILSGSGSDGARGCLAVHEAGGLVVAQAPSTANFPSMPQAVIDQVATSLKAGPGEMASLIARHVLGDPLTEARAAEVADVLNPTQRILFALRQRFGPDFGYYKQSTVSRRIERRVGLTKCGDLESYAGHLLEHADEMETLYHDLLIGVTGFFRDDAAFRAFENEALPGLLEGMRSGEQVRVWVAGCATGEEVYSLAILLIEGAERHQIPLNLKLFATDIHERSLAHASEAVYAADKLKGVDAERVERFFEPLDDGSYRVKPAVRRFVVFSKHNLIKDPPFSRLHLISCRNLLIYLGDAAQRKVMALFHFSLRKSGLLFLGSSETPGRLADEFTTVNARFRIFRKLRDVRLSASLELLPPSMATPEVQDDQQNLPTTPSSGTVALFRQLMPAYDTLLATYAPPGVLVDNHGHIVHVFGDAGRYLRPIGDGAVSMRAADRVHEALHVAVASGVDRALKQNNSSMASDLAVTLPDGRHERLDVQVTPIATRQGDDATHAFVGFAAARGRESTVADAAADAARGAGEPVVIARDEAARRIRELETDLRLTEESLQTTIEELETSNEELQAANEELQSSNEELQSTNEELYSINEELHTVSGEYEHRIEELVQLNSDMNNLLTSTDIGAIFLDRNLNLRRFTPAAAKLFHLVPHDVGRPISHVTSRIVSADLQEDIAAIQAGRSRIQREVTTDTGDEYIVRLLPYTTAEGRPDGVSLSFVDIGELKRTYAELEQRNAELAEANEELERFAYIASHDLKAPVRGCSHVLTFLRDDLDAALTAEQSEQFDAAIARLRQMETMLRELLDYARLGQEDPVAEPVDLAGLLRETVSLLEPPPGFEVQLREPLPAIEGAPGLVSLVFRNLVGNAIKHHHRDAGLITVRGERKNGRAEFFVSDDGPGIDPAMHKQIFEPFRKIDPQRGGTGMGLAFVKRALERGRGGIEIIASGPGQGTTFRVTLPMRPTGGVAG